MNVNSLLFAICNNHNQIEKCHISCLAFLIGNLLFEIRLQHFAYIFALSETLLFFKSNPSINFAESNIRKPNLQKED